MEGFLWLITQMTLLLTAAAILFFWLGWRWRSQDARKLEQSLNARIDAEVSATRSAQEDRDAARSKDHLHQVTESKLEADLLEANEHRRNLERDLIRVHDDLRVAKRDAEQRSEDLAEAKAALDQLQREKVSLELELATIKEARHTEELPSQAELQPQEKPKRVRKPTAAKAKAEKESKADKVAKPAKAFADAQSTLIRLETELLAKQILLTAVRQERDDWQRRVSTMREKGKDPAGLGLAQKSLARAEAAVSTAATAVAHLEHQRSALHRSLEQSATITSDDDLTKIKGIKAVLRDHLHAFGIRTFRQIAAWTDEDVEAFSELLAFKDRAKRDEWVKQAQELADKSA
jgi:predicted flap endonuclease-1-like 5' DNA nuclease